jgi:dUTP pyrophosphatase
MGSVPSSVNILIQRLSSRTVLPSYQSEQASGMDLYACFPDGTDEDEIEPGQIKTIPCGFAMAIPNGFEAQIRSRSGLATKFGITVINSPGTVDSDYRGEVKVGLVNLGQKCFVVRQGDRVAQMVIAPVARAHSTVTESLPASGRGSGGFGSTGV